jgi:uncharacterized protein
MKHARASLLVLGLILALAGPGVAQTKGWRDKVTAFAAKNLQEGLTYSHSRRDYALANSLAAADHVTLDEDVIFAAAYLHDMGGVSAFAEPNKDHADVSVAKINIVLADTDFPKAKLDTVRAAIRTHNFNRKPVGPEARYLHDADALDNLGASGVAWLLENVDSNGGKPTGQQLIKNFDNTKPIEQGVLTPAGKVELARRLAEQRAFLDALARETDGFKLL